MEKMYECTNIGIFSKKSEKTPWIFGFLKKKVLSSFKKDQKECKKTRQR